MAGQHNITIELIGRNRRTLQASNLVVYRGVMITTALIANHGRGPSHIALGTSQDAAIKTDWILHSETWRNAITRRYAKSSAAVFQLYVSTTQANSAEYYKEIGLFVAPWQRYTTAAAGLTIKGGTLFARANRPAFLKTSSDEMIITWEVPITNA